MPNFDVRSAAEPNINQRKNFYPDRNRTAVGNIRIPLEVVSSRAKIDAPLGRGFDVSKQENPKTRNQPEWPRPHV
jgi:hypothetical protein